MRLLRDERPCFAGQMKIVHERLKMPFVDNFYNDEAMSVCFVLMQGRPTLSL